MRQAAASCGKRIEGARATAHGVTESRRTVGRLFVDFRRSERTNLPFSLARALHGVWVGLMHGGPRMAGLDTKVALSLTGADMRALFQQVVATGFQGMGRPDVLWASRHSLSRPAVSQSSTEPIRSRFRSPRSAARITWVFVTSSTAQGITHTAVCSKRTCDESNRLSLVREVCSCYRCQPSEPGSLACLPA